MKLGIILFTFLITVGNSDCNDDQVELWGNCYDNDITNLTLINNGLSGEIPPELWTLTELVVIKLKYNNLTGPIPSDIGNLTNLTKLELQYNNLSGPLPTEFWALTNLKELRLQKNQLTGSIPPEIGNLNQLTHLYLYGNDFSGNLPSEIGNLISLVKLHMNNNQFTGLIPETICNMSDMNFFNRHLFDISGNQLTPPYPECVATFVEYQYHEECESNYLFNGICAEQSDLDILQQFIDNSSETINIEMDGNSNGAIDPIELGTQWWVNGRITELNCNYDLTNEFAMDDLGLSGQIPSNIGDLDSLEFLWLEDNQLADSIPPSIGELDKLKYLVLSHNQLSGFIPEEIGDLPNLEILKLDNNQLTGFIPDSVCKLNIEFNWQNSLFGENFAVYNNQLCPPYPDCVDSYVGIQNTSNCELTSDTFNPIPLDYSFYEPYPNPFNSQTKFQFSLPINDFVLIKVFDINGNELKTLESGIFDRGTYEFNWNAGSLPSGIYFIRLLSRHFTDTKKVSLIK